MENSYQRIRDDLIWKILYNQKHLENASIFTF